MRNADGDYPDAALRGVKTQINSDMHGWSDEDYLATDAMNALQTGSSKESMRQFNLYHKNVRGLASEDRLDELMLELLFSDWDIVSVNETWRDERREFFTVIGGHAFVGSGGSRGTRGVGFIVHRDLVSRLDVFEAVSERIAYIDITLHDIKLRIVTAYFPHAGYSDGHVHDVYMALSEIRRDALQKRRRFFLCGDFNAEVGSRLAQDNDASVGIHGLNNANMRGQWLKQWASSEKLCIANTFFSKRPQYRTTYTGPNGRPRQIDYILADMQRRD